MTGPLLELAAQQGFGFLPLHGRTRRATRIRPHHPGSRLDASTSPTSAPAPSNFFDHDVLGNSNIFFPLTIDRARIRGWEATVSSPRIAGRAQFHPAYSHQYAEGVGRRHRRPHRFRAAARTPFHPRSRPARHPFHRRQSARCRWRAWADFNLNYGSGFLDGEGPQHLPAAYYLRSCRLGSLSVRAGPSASPR